MAGIAVHQNRVQRRHHTVADDRISAFFKIQIAADMIDNNKILMDACLQMRDRLVETHAVEAGFLRIGKKSLEVLEGASHPGLAVALDHRHIDQKVDAVHRVDDVQLHAGAVNCVVFFFLSIHKRNAVLLAQGSIAAILIRLGCAIPDP